MSQFSDHSGMEKHEARAERGQISVDVVAACEYGADLQRAWEKVTRMQIELRACRKKIAALRKLLK